MRFNNAFHSPVNVGVSKRGVRYAHALFTVAREIARCIQSVKNINTDTALLVVISCAQRTLRSKACR